MILTPADIRRRQELTNKLNSGTFTYQEGEELKQLLEREKQEASDKGDNSAGILIGLLLLLLAFLASKKK